MTGWPASVGKNKGLALIAVLWMVAALSIFVLGISSSVNSEVRVLSKNRHALEARAFGEAAIYLTLRNMSSSKFVKSRRIYFDSLYDGKAINVEVIPVAGRIDLNTAPPSLLSTLLTIGGVVSPDLDDRFVAAIVSFRSPKIIGKGTQLFVSIEDLLQVSEVTYPLYARLSELITVDQRGSGLVNPLAASEEVLRVLSQGNLALAADIASKRNAGQAEIDTTGLSAAFIDSSSSERFQLVARVSMPDQKVMLIVRDIELGFGSGNGLPWRILKADQRYEN